MLSSAYQQVAYDTHLYYEGHPSDMLEKAYDKLALERERMMQLQNSDHFDTFEKFIDFDQDEILNDKTNPKSAG